MKRMITYITGKNYPASEAAHIRGNHLLGLMPVLTDPEGEGIKRYIYQDFHDALVKHPEMRCYFWLGLMTVIVTSNPKDVEYLLKTGRTIEHQEEHENVEGEENIKPLTLLHTRTEVFKNVNSLVGEGIFTASGALRENLRKVYHHNFQNTGLLQEYLKVMQAFATQQLGMQATRNLREVCLYYATNLMLATIVKVSSEDLDSINTPLIEAIRTLMQEVMNFSNIIKWNVPGTLRKLMYMGHEYTSASEFKDMIQNRLRDIFGKYVSNPEQNSFVDSIKHLKPNDQVNVMSEVVLLFFAGVDSTAGTLDFAVRYLHRHPEILNSIRAEFAKIEQDRETSQEITLQQYSASKIPLMNAFLYEVWRLSPLFPLLTRSSTQTTYLGKLEVEPRTMILISLYTMSRDPRLWGDDANQFSPSRFLDEEGKLKNLTEEQKKCYIPFGLGRQSCVAEKFALYAILVFIGELTKYNFSLNLVETENEAGPSSDLDTSPTSSAKNTDLFFFRMDKGTPKLVDAEITLHKRSVAANSATMFGGSSSETQVTTTTQQKVKLGNRA